MVCATSPVLLPWERVCMHAHGRPPPTQRAPLDTPQGWLSAASQACGFILTLNPLESLTPIPQGIMGLFVLSIGFIAYVLIAASGALIGSVRCASGRLRGGVSCMRPCAPYTHMYTDQHTHIHTAHH
jgi:hypothetical protein